MPRWNIEVSVDSRGVVTGANVAGQATGRMAGKMKTADKAVMGLGRQLKLLGGILAGGLLLRGFKSALDAVKEEEAAVRGLESRLRGLGPEALASSAAMQQFASELQRTTGIGNEEILRLQSVLLTFRRIGPEIFGELTETVLDVAEVMGTDAKSAALQLGKALDDPARRVSELSRAGITFSQSQQDVIKALVESGELLEAQKLVLKEVRAQYGQAARDARDTLAGSIRALSSTWGDFQETLMEESGSQGAMRVAIESWIDAITWLQTNWANFEAAFHLAMGAIVGSVVRGVGFIVSGYADWSEALDKLIQAMPWMTDAQQELSASTAKWLRETGDKVTDLGDQFKEGFAAKADEALKRFQKSSAGAAGAIKGFGDGMADTAGKADKVTEAVNEQAEAFYALARSYREWGRLVASVDILDPGDFVLPLTLPYLEGETPDFDFWVDAFNDAVMADTPPAFQEVADQFGDQVGQAIANAILSGDLASAVDAFARILGAKLSESISAAFGGGFGASLAGGVVGTIVSAVITDIFSAGRAITTTTGTASVAVFDNATAKLLEGSLLLGKASRDMSRFALSLRSQLTGLESLLGGALLSSPQFDVTETSAGEFHASLIDAGQVLAGGVGSSVSEAMQAALDKFARDFSELLAGAVEGGRFNPRTGEISDPSVIPGMDLSGLDPVFLAALADLAERVGFIDFAHVAESVQLWSDAMNSVTNTLGAWTPATDSAMQRIEAMRVAIERSGLSAEAAAPFLAQLAQSAAILRQQASANFFKGIAQVMQQMGMNEQEIANFRARAAQMEFKLTIAKLQIEAKALNLTGKYWENLFKMFNKWAENMANFVVATVNLVAPVIGKIGRIRKIKMPKFDDGIKKAKERWEEFITSLGFTGPGASRPGRSGLNAAMAEARRAYAAGDIDAAISAARAALSIGSELYGTTLGMDNLLAQIRAIGLDPSAPGSNPVVDEVKQFADRNATGLTGIQETLGEILQEQKKLRFMAPATS